jgi:TonB family protein
MSKARITMLPFIIVGLLNIRPSSLNAQPQQSNEFAVQGQQQKSSEDKEQGKPNKADLLKIVRKARAVYPDEALDKGIEGTVKIKFTVSENGEIVKAKAVTGHKLLRLAAIDALLKSRYSNGFKKRINATISYSFKLDNPDALLFDAEEEPADTGMTAEEQGLKLIEKGEPVYPQAAKDKGVEGKIAVEIKVNENGEVIEAKVKNGPELLHEAAIDAAKKYRFLNPQKQQVTATIIIGFEL